MLHPASLTSEWRCFLLSSPSVLITSAGWYSMGRSNVWVVWARTHLLGVLYREHKNIERHKAHTIVSWPNPKKMGNSSYFRFDDDNKTKYIYIYTNISDRHFMSVTATGDDKASIKTTRLSGLVVVAPYTLPLSWRSLTRRLLTAVILRQDGVASV